MQKFTLRSSDPNRKNSKVVLLHSGETSFNEKGEATVELESEDQLADMLVSYPDLTSDEIKEPQQPAPPAPETVIPPAPADAPPVLQESAPLAPQVENQELGKAESDKNDIGAAEGSDDDATGDDALSKSLDEMNLESLKALAEESGFPKEDWEALTKKPLKAYLKQKLEQADANN